MIEQLLHLLNTNPVASGGLFFLFSGAAMGLIYKAQSYMIRFIRFMFFTQLNFTSEDGNFIPIQNWLFNQEYTRNRCSNFMVKNVYRQQTTDDIISRHTSGTDPEPPSQIFVPSYGTHYFMIGWRPVILNYSKSEAKEIRHQEFINLQIFNLRKKFNFTEELVKEANKIYSKQTYTETSIFGATDRWSSWHKLLKKHIRQQPILSHAEEYNEIVDDIQTFLDNKEWYNKRGINYKHGILFAGVPGSGKTSCVLSLAQKFQRHIYMLNLGDSNIDDAHFIDLVTSLPKNAIFLLEDIDAISSIEDRKNNKKEDKEDANTQVSLSTILNTLDGLLTPDGLIFVITTNYPEKLDEALIRQGRIDLTKYFNNANEYQIGALFDRFLPEGTKEEKNIFIQNNINKPMAAIEASLIGKIL